MSMKRNVLKCASAVAVALAAARIFAEGAPSIVTETLPAATEMTQYSFRLTATNGTPPYAWSTPNG